VKYVEKKTLLVLGLIGGIIAAVGVFLPWQSVLGINISGWDVTATASYPYVILLGGVLAIIGALVALVSTVKGVGYLVPIGGIVALLGWIWAAADVGFGNLLDLSYGFWACLVGAIIALIGSPGVRK
jgi:membrane associated rhomboid family serine protease